MRPRFFVLATLFCLLSPLTATADSRFAVNINNRSSPIYSRSYDLTDQDVSFQASRDGSNGLSFVIGYDRLTLSAPIGSRLVAGRYLGVRSYATAANAAVTFNYSSHDQRDNKGELNVLEVTYDENGEVLSLAVDFVLEGNLFAGEGITQGRLRYHSAFPLSPPNGTASVQTGTYRPPATSGSLAVTITRADGITGPLTVDFATADGTALAGRDYLPVSGTLSWADREIGEKTVNIPILNAHFPVQDGNVFYLNLSGPGAGTLSQTAVTVVGDDSAVTFLHYVSDADGFEGSGEDVTLNFGNGHIFTPVSYDDGSRTIFIGSKPHPLNMFLLDEIMFSFGPGKGQVLAVGNYPDANGEPGSSKPFISPGTNSRAGGAERSFQVRELAYDDEGNLARLAIDFELRGTKFASTLRGQLRYHSTVPAPSLAELPQVFVEATNPITQVDYIYPGIFTIRRNSGLSDPLTVYYKLKGDAVSGTHYRPLSGKVLIKAGKASATVKIKGLATGVTGNHNVILKILPQPDKFTVSGTGKAKVKISEYAFP